MKIVHVDAHVSWRGGEQQVLYLTRFLGERGHDSLVICQPHSALYRRVREAGLPVRALPIRHEVDVVAAWRLGTYLRQQRVDILHMHGPHDHTIGLLASVLAPKVRKVVSRRVVFVPIRNRWSRWKYMRPGVCYVAISEAVRRVLIAGGVPAHTIQTIHSGIDLCRFDEVLPAPMLFPAGTRVIGTVGQLDRYKGHGCLLEAMRSLLQTESQVGLVIAGAGTLRADLEAQAMALGIADQVRFTGFRDDILALMQSFEIFVFPSIMEGLGTAMLDAMALRKPVVATRAGGIPEVLQDGVTGLLVPPQDHEALARAMRYVLHHPEQGQALGEAGRKRVEQYFTAEHMAARTLHVYQRLLNETPAP